MIGCSPQQRITRIVKKHPHLAQTEVVVERDTVKIPELKEVTRLEIVQDTAKFDSLLMRFKELSYQIDISTHPEQLGRLERTIHTLKRQILASVTPDTSYFIHLPRNVTVGDTTFIVSTTVEIELKEGELTHTHSQEAIVVPYEKKIVNTNIDARGDLPWWYWVILGVVAISGIWLGRKM